MPVQKGPTEFYKNVGRDRYTDGSTIWLAGGGFRPGMAYGETDEFAMQITRDKVGLHDLHATLLQMGFDHR
ncbi:MAG: DUF1501 domain-containing protein [Planctomycetota bacterium]